ncbi:MAG: hypothetical protein ACLFRD_10110 [Nitriliruptoraceae bacterium]
MTLVVTDDGATAFDDVSIVLAAGSDRPLVVDPDSRGVTPTGLLSSEEFDATEVALDSLRFGPGGARVERSVVTDLDGDGRDDLRLFFDTHEADLAETDGTVCQHGTLPDEQPFSACQDIRLDGERR